MVPTTDDATALGSDEWLCLALYTASRAMTARYRPILTALGLTYPQYLVMTALWENGPATVGQLGSRLSLDSSTLSPLLKRLERMGLVSRTRASQDERTVDIRLTPRGHDLSTHAVGIPDEICSATGLSPEELAALVAQLRNLTDQLDRGNSSAVHD